MPVTSWMPSSNSTSARLGTGRVWKSPQQPQAYTAYQSANQELFEAACQAIRLLQDRQQHMPPEMIDGRERRVLKAFRLALCGRP
jgi:hypothetical protein